MATATDRPRTLTDAQVYLSGLWPGSGAPPAALVDFYKCARETYANVAEVDNAHSERALWWAEECEQLGELHAKRVPAGGPNSHLGSDRQSSGGLQ